MCVGHDNSSCPNWPRIRRSTDVDTMVIYIAKTFRVGQVITRGIAVARQRGTIVRLYYIYDSRGNDQQETADVCWGDCPITEIGVNLRECE